MSFGRKWKNWGGLGSMMRYCMFYKARNGKWYMELAPFEHGGWEDADTYGPFPSLDAADAFLRDNFSNPGGDDVDDSGTREVPTHSPNGGPVIDPRKQRRGWFGFGDAASDRRADVGRIIFEQFGGGRAMAMIGGQAMLLNTPNYGEGGLGIKWPNRQRSKGNYVEILLRPDDTYNMTFYNLTIRAKKPVKVYEGIYADQLRPLFEKQTGWYLSLGGFGGRRKVQAPYSGMRVYDQGSLVRVTIDEWGVHEFKQQWPGSGIPDTNVSFIFEKRNGDLVDLHPYELDGSDVLALSHDAWNHAVNRLGLDPSLKR
jgi:hypothetical protein